VTSIFSVLYEGGELKGAILGIRGSGRRPPCFDLAAESNCEVLTGGREDKRRDRALEGEVV
jgi:hypothetical protein